MVKFRKDGYTIDINTHGNRLTTSIIFAVELSK